MITVVNACEIVPSAPGDNLNACAMLYYDVYSMKQEGKKTLIMFPTCLIVLRGTYVGDSSVLMKTTLCFFCSGAWMRYRRLKEKGYL